ncbi:replication-relaxation family protein [Paenibacillus sp. MMO-58]|uniref:replication-relaxation family protein n=1 Tax=Paenibacillus sp. MMO-58 TaxID=3081290 RepID=UPI00301813B0
MTNSKKPKRSSNAKVGGKEIKQKKQVTNELSLGDAISRLSSRDWRLLIDLYLCRVMPQNVIIETFFLDSPELYYREYESADEEGREQLVLKNRNRAVIKGRRTLRELQIAGLTESTKMIPDEMDKPVHLRKSVRGESWYYLTARGLRVVETKIGAIEESKLSKVELDMERAKKDHIWELGKVYLDLRYNWMVKFPEFVQFQDWDWHPSLTVYSDNQTMEIRPDSVLRIGEQLLYVELDRSTEPVQRSPFYSNQVSIKMKLERYRSVMKLTTNPIQRSGIIAFILPEAVKNTRLENIQKAADDVFKGEQKVFVGRTIGDIIMKLVSIEESSYETP